MDASAAWAGQKPGQVKDHEAGKRNRRAQDDDFAAWSAEDSEGGICNHVQLSDRAVRGLRGAEAGSALAGAPLIAVRQPYHEIMDARRPAAGLFPTHSTATWQATQAPPFPAPAGSPAASCRAAH